MNLFLCLSFVILPIFLCQKYDFQTKYVQVPIDHFSFTVNSTFKLKYLINDTYWIDDGPIFFYTGNEGNIETFAENTGFIFDIAPVFNALIVFAEHRYYGTSLPFGNLSYSSPKYLGYLSSSQALADYVFLISQLQQKYATLQFVGKLPVIAFGGSYGGMLAAWLRMKYPFSVIGAIASSAPIWQFTGLTPCENFNRIVTNVYKYSYKDTDCSLPIKQSWKMIRNLTSTNDGKIWISNQWKLCKPLKTNDDVDNFIEWFTEILVNMAMVNYPYPTNFLAPLPPFPVRAFCEKLSEVSQNQLINLASASEIYTNFTQTTKCNNISQSSFNLGELGWGFQACTEMIMPMCSTEDDMFENEKWDFDKYENDCFKIFGVKQLKQNLPIMEYGGKDLEAASNIIFSNGLLDPWSSGGVLSNISNSIFAVVIPEGAHHLDLRAANKLDPPSVIEARKFHVSIIKKWVNDYYSVYGEKHFSAFPFYEKIKYVHINDL